MTVLTSPKTLGELLKREFDRDYHREVVTLKAGTDYPLGSVLGRITADGKYELATKEAASPAATGSEIACAVLIEAVDATEADAQGLVLVRGPVILADAALHFDASVDDEAAETDKHAQLAAFGLVVRHAV